MSEGRLEAQSQTAPLELRSKGSAKAPVTVYEMSDFQCPYCRTFHHDVWPRIEREYVATVRGNAAAAVLTSSVRLVSCRSTPSVTSAAPRHSGSPCSTWQDACR